MNKIIIVTVIILVAFFSAFQYFYNNYYLTKTEWRAASRVNELERQAKMSDPVFSDTLQNSTVYQLARNLKRKQDLQKNRRAIEMYHSINGDFPSSLSVLTPEYFPQPLLDPSTLKPYHDYYLNFKSTGYKLCVNQEDDQKESTRECYTSDNY